MFRRTFSMLSSLLFLALAGVSNAPAQGVSSVQGTWYLNITLDGAPPCQCIQISDFYPDGRITGPAGDRLSGEARGQWALTAPNQVALSIVQNNINADGTAGGLYIYKGTMTLTGGGKGQGTIAVQIVDNSGAVVFSGTASFKATQVVAGK